MTLNLQSRALPLVATAFFVAFSLQAVPAQAANTEVPTADLAGLSDPPGLKRYIGSVLIYRDDVAYDEIEFPAGKALRADGVMLKNSKALTSSGKRALAMYITPAGRSSLEVIRSYQQDLREMDGWLQDRRENWLQPHFSGASEPATQLVLVIEGG